MKGFFLIIFTCTLALSHGGESKGSNKRDDSVKNPTTQQLCKAKAVKKKNSNSHTTKQYIFYSLILAATVCSGYLFYKFKKKDGLSHSIDQHNKKDVDESMGSIKKHNEDVDRLMSKLESLEGINIIDTWQDTLEDCLRTRDILAREAQKFEQKVDGLDGAEKRPFIKKCMLTNQAILDNLIKQHNKRLDVEMRRLDRIKYSKLRTMIKSSYKVTMGIQIFKGPGKLYNKKAELLASLKDDERFNGGNFGYDDVKNCTDKLYELLNMFDSDYDEGDEKRQYVLYILHSRLKSEFSVLFPRFPTDIKYKNFDV